MNRESPPTSFDTDELVAPPDGGDWTSIVDDTNDVARLRRILDIVKRQGILMSTRGGWYYTSDDERGFVIRNEGGNPMECPCRQARDETGACDHIWAIRAIRCEFFPGSPRTKDQPDPEAE